LDYFPHHVHDQDGAVRGIEQIPDAIFIIQKVEEIIESRSALI
jgi:hypothetical protein